MKPLRHFLPPASDDKTGTQLPRRAYGKLDHTEPELTLASPSVLVAFDVVDADLMDDLKRNGVVLDLNDPESSKTFWQRYWADLLATPRDVTDDPLENLHLFRVEMVFDRGDPLLDRLLGSNENSAPSESDATPVEPPPRWLEFQFGPGCRSPAEVYPRMFGPPLLTFTNFKPTSISKAKSLSESFSLDHLPRAARGEVLGSIGTGAADSLAIYDVGQGSASALLSGDIPWLYFDLGCGVYRNAPTTPHQLRFCQRACSPTMPSRNPVVLLSHWDADHWAGVFADPANYPLLQSDWIAPYQDEGCPGIPHIGLAHDIIYSGGRLLIYDPAPGHVDPVTLPTGRQLNLLRATGKSRNDSGFVVCVDDTPRTDLRSWLLTGDADYDCFLELLGGRAYEACVVPHHGATLATSTPVAKPVATRRLCFSFGPNNSHGRNGRVHPTKPAVDSYRAMEWIVDPWNHIAEPGHRQGTHDIRSTCLHGSPGTHLGGVFIEWGLPGRPHRGCGGRWCTAGVPQFT